MDLPDFRKFNTENLDTAAYTEGWALYCETLGREFGFYDEPDAYFGHLNNELLRAVRLVVDTGMHAQGWSREQGDRLHDGDAGIFGAPRANQIERYMARPAQALAYKIGALKILELRERAQQALGGRFSYAQIPRSVHGRRHLAAADPGSTGRRLDQPGRRRPALNEQRLESGASGPRHRASGIPARRPPTCAVPCRMILLLFLLFYLLPVLASAALYYARGRDHDWRIGGPLERASAAARQPYPGRAGPHSSRHAP